MTTTAYISNDVDIQTTNHNGNVADSNDNNNNSNNNSNDKSNNNSNDIVISTTYDMMSS